MTTRTYERPLVRVIHHEGASLLASSGSGSDAGSTMTLKSGNIKNDVSQATDEWGASNRRDGVWD